VTTQRKATGARGEALATEYLRGAGYTILGANWRCRLGEIDVIAQDGPVLVFVEVRTRSSARLGSPEESVTSTKRRRLADLAQTYLLFLEHAGRPWAGPWRIDVIALEVSRRSGTATRLNHLVNAIEGA
jgi:putative endonuclease